MPNQEAPPILDPRRLRLGLAIAVAIGAAAAIGAAVVGGAPAILSGAARLPWSVIALCLALDAASWAGEGVTFASLAGLRGVRGWLRGMSAYVGGGFPGLVTPFGSGALPGWAFALTREGLSAGEAAAVLGARGLVTSLLFVAAGAVALIALPARLAGSAAASGATLVGLAAVLALVVFMVARPRTVAAAAGRALSSRLGRAVIGQARAERAASTAEREAERFSRSLRDLVRRRPAALVAALAGLLVSRACLLAILPVLLFGLGWRGDPWPVVAAVVGIWALASGSPTPGGSGAVEVATTAALATVAPVATAAAAALLWRGLTFYVDIVVGWAIFVRYVGMRPPGEASPTSTEAAERT